DLNRIRARVNRAGDVRAVPVHHDRDVIPLRGARTPVAGPGAGQRVTFLGETRHRHRETRAQRTEAEKSSMHGRNIALWGPGRNGDDGGVEGESSSAESASVDFSFFLPDDFSSSAVLRSVSNHDLEGSKDRHVADRRNLLL